MKCFLAFLFWLWIYNKVVYGASYKVSPVSLQSCEGTEKLINLEFKPVNDGQKAWFGSATIPTTIDAATDFVWEMRWWKDDAWEKTPKIFKGKACFYLQKFAGKVWKDLREAAKPPLDVPCPVKAGTYTFDKFITDYSDIHLPMMQKGRWSGKITIKKDGKTMCALLVVDMI